MCLVRALERLGNVAISKEEPDIGAAFLKFSVVTKDLSTLMKTLVSFEHFADWIPNFHFKFSDLLFYGD